MTETRNRFTVYRTVEYHWNLIGIISVSDYGDVEVFTIYD